MALGISPKNIQSLKTQNLQKNHALVIALETVKKLSWNIGSINKNGFVAYTKASMSSWSEEVQIKIEEESINIKSECTGSQMIDWGKNKKNVNAFITKFNSILSDYDLNQLDLKYEELKKEFVSEEYLINKSPISQKGKISSFFSLFIPSDGYTVTPILLILNIIIFIIMIITGVNIIMPESESLLLWGANFKPLTLEGEWWRLISSCFLHIGIIHLLMNMYALLYIGLLIEPYLGKARFLTAYLITGIVGSLSSLFWNELTISAGASGAIFGMYGVFLAMLSTDLIEKSARQAMMTSIAIFVAYNLLNGLKGDVDNAAHIGGLVSGLIVGYAFYPSLLKPNTMKLKYGTIGLLTILTVILSFSILSTTKPSDIPKYEKEMERFILLEEKALRLYDLPQTATDQEYLDEIRNNGIPNWKLNLELIEKVEKLDLPQAIHKRNSKLKEYCNLRIASYEMIAEMIAEGTDTYQLEVDSNNRKIEIIINELSKQ